MDSDNDGSCDPVCPTGKKYIDSSCCADTNNNNICDNDCDDPLAASSDRCV